MKTTMKTPRGMSESSTTSDNTTEFIDIVKKYDVVYNTHNPDYKNVEVKMKVWSQIAEEIGLSVDASKRKWKNLRDSYTKYLRSFRIGTKTSKKYQYWAHADHMDFLKPYQGPGRTSSATNSGSKPNDEEDTECDLGYQVLAKTTTASEDDVKITITTAPPTTSSSSTATITCSVSSASIAQHTSPLLSSSATSFCTVAATTCTTTTLPNSLSHNSNTMMLPMPSLPTVQLPPQFIGKSMTVGGSSLPIHHPLLPTTVSTQIFSIPALSSVGKNSCIPSVPVTSSASGVGCLIIEPHLFAPSVDNYKKELNTPAFGLFHSIVTQSPPTTTTTTPKINPPLITKIRRVQQPQQTSAVNLSFTASPNSLQQPPPKTRKLGDSNSKKSELDISAVLQANRDLDANTLFFLSLAKTVRSMPIKFQSLAKMRCMRIVSDIELELENVIDCNGSVTDDGLSNGNKYSNIDSPPDGNCMTQSISNVNDAGTEHFVYVMSPSRVESMIDISSEEEENTMNGI